MRFLVALLATAVVLVGCGSDTGERASASSDASTLLRSTFANLAELRSATVDLKATASPRTGDAASARVQGPFELADEGLPRFALTATLASAAHAQQVGATWTGEKGFATLDGTSYEVPSLIVAQLTAGYEQALRGSGTKGAVPLLGTVDVARWVPNARNEGVADVGGVETIKLTGDADVPAVMADLERLSAQLKAMNVPGVGQGLPNELPAGAADAVKDLTVTVFTGAEDRLLRRLVVDGTVQKPGGKAQAAVLLDLTLTKVGDEQEIAAPEQARPFSELMGKFGVR